MATAPSLALGPLSATQQLFDTGWEDASGAGANLQPVLVKGSVLDGWNLVTKEDQRQSDQSDQSGFEVWASGDTMKAADGQSYAVSAAPGDGSKFTRYAKKKPHPSRLQSAYAALPLAYYFLATLPRLNMFKSFILMLQFIAFLFSPMALASESLCKNNEKIIFSCPVGHAKTVSVCASKSLANGGYIQYRFGRKDKIDLSIPSTTKASDVSIDGNSGGNRSGGSFIRFRIGVYSYVVLSLYNMPSDPETGCNGGPCEQVGVLVEKSGNVISRLSCQGTYGAEITDFPNDYLDMFGIPRAKTYWPE